MLVTVGGASACTPKSRSTTVLPLASGTEYAPDAGTVSVKLGCESSRITLVPGDNESSRQLPRKSVTEYGSVCPTINDQEKMLPVSPATLSVTSSCQVPFAEIPLNAESD